MISDVSGCRDDRGLVFVSEVAEGFFARSCYQMVQRDEEERSA